MFLNTCIFENIFLETSKLTVPTWGIKLLDHNLHFSETMQKFSIESEGNKSLNPVCFIFLCIFPL